MTDNQRSSQQAETDQRDISPPFPAPRVWDFVGDNWTGVAHQRDTSDFMLSGPTPDDIGIIASPKDVA